MSATPQCKVFHAPRSMLRDPCFSGFTGFFGTFQVVCAGVLGLVAISRHAEVWGDGLVLGSSAELTPEPCLASLTVLLKIGGRYL